MSQFFSSNPKPPRAENAAYYPALDGLRAVALLMVFFRTRFRRLPWGWTGSGCLFVLSGFLITGILFDLHGKKGIGSAISTPENSPNLSPLLGILLALLVITPFMHWHWSWGWLIWPTYLGNFGRFMHPYASNSEWQRIADFQLAANHRHIRFYFGHFWTLCVEEQFYLFWPWIVFYLRDRRRLMYLCGAIVVLSPLLRLYAQHTLPAWMLEHEILYRFTPVRLDVLSLEAFSRSLYAVDTCVGSSPLLA